MNKSSLPVVSGAALSALLSAALLFPALAQTDTAPTQTAPAQTVPVQTAPVQAVPVTTPSVPGGVPTDAVPQTAPAPALQPPVTQPPVTQPPVTQPPVTQPASAQTWTHDSLQAATYLMLPARLEGNIGLLSADQQAGVLTALNHDSRAALARKYPAAQFTGDPATPNVVTVQPVAVMPAGFWPWATLQGRLEFSDPLGNRVVAQSTFNLLTVYQQQAQAANYIFDMIMAKLP